MPVSKTTGPKEHSAHCTHCGGGFTYTALDTTVKTFGGMDPERAPAIACPHCNSWTRVPVWPARSTSLEPER